MSEHQTINNPSAFTDLVVWQSGHSLVLKVYAQIKVLPIEEKFNLIDQLRRSALSVTNNIAEGYSRQSKKEKLHFYYVALGSLREVENCLIVCNDLEYISSADHKSITEIAGNTGRLLNGLIRSTKLRT